MVYDPYDQSNILYDGPLKTIVDVSGQGNTDGLLARIFYDDAKTTYEELDIAASDFDMSSLSIDEVLHDQGEAYIAFICTEGRTDYAVSFDGNDKFAPFEFTIQFD